MNMMRNAIGPFSTGQLNSSHYNALPIQNTRLLSLNAQKYGEKISHNHILCPNWGSWAKIFGLDCRGISDHQSVA
jgi:hypothetical protein